MLGFLLIGSWRERARFARTWTRAEISATSVAS